MSKIEVDAITQQSGSTLTVGGGASKTVVADATTVTLGRCGGTVALASGATQSGFGRTGTVDWQTGSIKSSATFTAANGEGYFVDTSSNGVTANLPAGAAGAIVSFADYANNFASNALTIAANGSDKIGGGSANATLSTDGQAVTLVFVDSTKGWIDVNDTTENVVGSPFISATGGTVATCGNDKIHTFTGPGTFTVARAATCAANNEVSYVVVAGGGGGGGDVGGGGGAGGYRETKSPVTPYTASPLDGQPSAPNRITVTATAFPIAVGGGGTGGLYDSGSSSRGVTGSVSTFSTITSAGGGGGGSHPEPAAGTGLDGGSGGGGGSRGGKAGGSGNTPPTTPAQGGNGGNATPSPSPTTIDAGAGGGGASGNASNASDCTASVGANGVASSITGSPVTRAGGGGGGIDQGGGGSSGASGGSGGGGDGGPKGGVGLAGTTNTGGGGGGSSKGSPGTNGGTGGSGIVIIRYKFQ